MCDTIDFYSADPSRHLDGPVRRYWPRRTVNSVPIPLVVFSHGIGSSRQGYRHLGAYWASHGYASLHLQHVGSDSSLWWGNPLNLFERLHAATSEREAVDRVKDLSFALDQVLAGRFGGHIDRMRIIAAGHSYGANTVMLATGARLVRGDKTVEYRDPRIKAAVLLSAPPFYGERNPAAIVGAIQVPTLHVTTTQDV